MSSPETPVPIIDRDLLEKMVKQAINFDQLQEVVKAEADRIVLKVIQPQIANWLRDLAQQINSDIDSTLKKTFGEPDTKEAEFKKELLKNLIHKIISSKEHVHEILENLLDSSEFRNVRESIIGEFKSAVREYVDQWIIENGPKISEELHSKIGDFLKEPASDLVRREIMATIDRFGEINKKIEDDRQQNQNNISEIYRRLQTLEQGKRF